MDNPQNDTSNRERDLESGTAATADVDELQRRQRGSLPSFLFITFLYFMLTNRNGEDSARSQYEDAIRALGYQLSNYSAWLNGTATNFTLVRDSQFSRASTSLTPSRSLNVMCMWGDWSRIYYPFHTSSIRHLALTIQTPLACFVVTSATTTFLQFPTTRT